MASTSFQTWTYSFMAPMPYGATRLDIVRYKPTGVRLVIVPQLLRMLRISAPRFKELVAGMEATGENNDRLIQIFREKDMCVIRRLQAVGAVAPGAKLVLTVAIKDAIRLIKYGGAWEALLRPLKGGYRSEPPSSANNLGTSKLDRPTAPILPLPMSRLAVAVSATGDYGEEEQQEADEEQQQQEGAAALSLLGGGGGGEIPWPAAPPPWREREGGGATPPNRRYKPAAASMASPDTTSPPSKWAPDGKLVKARMINTAVGR